MAEGPRIVVLGAGPAGLRAALAAAESGAQVSLVDAQPEPGGQIWRGLWRQEAPGQAGALFRALRASTVQLRLNRRVVTAPGSGHLGLLSPEGAELLTYDRLIVATGARERFLPFPGWTLPGVLGAGGLQGLVKGGLAIQGQRVVVAGSGPLLLAVAASLKARGARVRVVAEQAPLRAVGSLLPSLITRPGTLMQALSYLHLPLRPSTWVTRAEGEGRLQRVYLRTPRGPRVLEADYLACGFGLVPNLELARLLGCRVDQGVVVVDELLRTSVPGVFAAGESTGIGGVDKALAEGRMAGLMAAGLEAEARRSQAAVARTRQWGERVEAAHALREDLRDLAESDTCLCRCEDLTVGQLRAFARGRDARVQGRCGMGRCQGRTCGPATEFLFGWEPGGPRQPLVPTTFGDLLAALSPTEHP